MTRVTRVSLVERLLLVIPALVLLTAAVIALIADGIASWMRSVDWPLMGLAMVLAGIVVLTAAAWAARLGMTR